MPTADALQWLAGSAPRTPRPLPPFAPGAIDFLSDLSTELRGDPAVRSLADVQTFAFWSRRGNLERLKAAHDTKRGRLGRGLLFHIAPSNVPVTFAYSFAFGLLAGNAGVVRVPSRQSATVDAICRAAGRVLERREHDDLSGMTAFVRYPAESGWTAVFSAQCDGRIIWGGDAAIAEIRKEPMPPQAIELVFPDRTSLAVMDAGAVGRLDAAQLRRLAENFYNDTLVMDQNACSSPHLVMWLGEGGERQLAARRFWEALAAWAEDRYRLAPVQAVERHTRLLSAIVEQDGAARLLRFRNRIAVLELARLPDDCEALRGRFGLFWQWHAGGLDELCAIVTRRFQTLTYFGLEREALRDVVIRHRLSGIDRIVPVGRALDMNSVWDGMDLIAQLSRIVDMG